MTRPSRRVAGPLLLLLLSACPGANDRPSPPSASAGAFAAAGPDALSTFQCGTELATGDEADAEVSKGYSDWKRKYLARADREGRLRVRAGEEYEEGTPSEAIGYGMLLSVYLDDRPTFDGLWAFARQYRNSRGLMAWHVGADGRVVDSNAATDGDEDIAFALMVANQRWGGYEQAAREVISALLRHAVEPRTEVLRPGDVWGGSSVTNPSYFAPAYYRAFASFTNEPRWDRVADASYRVLDRVVARHSPSTGLQPEWATAQGDSVRDGDGYPFHYGYNAARVPWRLAMDAAWNCDARALRHLRLINAFFRRVGADEIRDGYTLAGRPRGRHHNGAFVGPAAAAAVLAEDADHRRAMWRAAAALEPSNYYNDTLRLLSLLFATGRMDPWSADGKNRLDAARGGGGGTRAGALPDVPLFFGRRGPRPS